MQNFEKAKLLFEGAAALAVETDFKSSILLAD